MFPLDGRKAALFMSERTLLSFVILEGRIFDAAAIGQAFWAGLAQTLSMEGYKKRDIDEIVDSYSELVLAKTKNASQTAQINSIARDYKLLVRRRGGLKRYDIGSAIANVNGRPRRAVGWATPEEIVREVLTARAA